VKERAPTWLFMSLAITIVAISIFLLTMTPWLKRPMGSADHVIPQLTQVAELARSNRWPEAEASMVPLRKAWQIVAKRLAYGVTSDELHTFSLGLADLQGAVEARDSTQVRIAYQRLLTAWAEIGGK
jgi:hypothetical protein